MKVALYANNYVCHLCSLRGGGLSKSMSCNCLMKKDITNLRKASIIMCWSVFILWHWPQTNQHIDTAKLKNAYKLWWVRDFTFICGLRCIYVHKKIIMCPCVSQSTSECGLSEEEAEEAFWCLQTWTLIGPLRTDGYQVSTGSYRTLTLIIIKGKTWNLLKVSNPFNRSIIFL